MKYIFERHLFYIQLTFFYVLHILIFVMQCPRDYYGLEGELCLDCRTTFLGPEAATCENTEEKQWGGEPVSKPGWWKVALVTEEEKEEGGCHPDRMHRGECPEFLPCQPKGACVGENTCLEGYQHLKLLCETKHEKLSDNPQWEVKLNETCSTDSECNGSGGGCSLANPELCMACIEERCQCQPHDRCSMCTVSTHFREAGVCAECPKFNPLMLLGIAAGVVAAGMGLLFITRSGVSVVVMSIAVDYFQVLAMFRRSHVSWPEELLVLFRYLSVFNLNLDLVAPEVRCLIIVLSV